MSSHELSARLGETRFCLTRGSAMINSLLGTVVELPLALVALYPELREATWRRGGLPPRVGGWFLGRRSVAAITLWHTVYIAPDVVPHPELLLHELGHVRQFGASIWFPLRYIWESARRGYSGNKYEHEAQAFAVARLRSTNLSTHA